MSAQAFGAFVQHESDKTPTPATKVIHRDSITSGSPSTIELDQIEWGKRLNGPTHENEDPIPSPRDLEASQPPTPKRSQAVDALLQSVTNPPRNKWRLASAIVMFLLMGMNDAAVSVDFLLP